MTLHPPVIWLLLLVTVSCAQHDSSHATTDTPPLSHANALEYSYQLQELANADQADRQRILQVFREHGFRSAQADTANRWLMRRDSLHLQQFRELERRYGWPRAAEVGTEGVGNAYLLLQHAPDSVHTRYLPRIEQAYQQDELPGSDYATYLDRVLTQHGRKQRYGTQFRRRELPDHRTEDYLDSIEDMPHVEQRRRAVGLDSLTPRLQPGTLVLKPD